MNTFPPLQLLHDNWQIIADECCGLDRNFSLDVSDIKKREDVLLLMDKPQWIRGWDGIEGWLNWGIALNYQYPFGDANVPKTAAILKRISGIKFANISLLRPKTELPTHTHPENKGLLTFHLGLEVPFGCYLGIHGNETMEENGKTIIFDGSLPHYSKNTSLNDRLILYCEFDSGRLGFIQ